jgi:hypothetical protein
MPPFEIKHQGRLPKIEIDSSLTLHHQSCDRTGE